MIGCKIVLVLGAGASVPYGFPDGSTLVRQIVQTAQGGSAYDAFSRWSGGKWKKDRIDLFCSESIPLYDGKSSFYSGTTSR